MEPHQSIPPPPSLHYYDETQHAYKQYDSSRLEISDHRPTPMGSSDNQHHMEYDMGEPSYPMLGDGSRNPYGREDYHSGVEQGDSSDGDEYYDDDYLDEGGRFDEDEFENPVLGFDKPPTVDFDG